MPALQLQGLAKNRGALGGGRAPQEQHEGRVFETLRWQQCAMRECARPDSDERVPQDNLFLRACSKDLESNEHLCCKHVGRALHLPHAGRFNLASLLQARRARCSREQRAPLLQARRALHAGVAAGKHVFTRLCCKQPCLHACLYARPRTTWRQPTARTN